MAADLEAGALVRPEVSAAAYSYPDAARARLFAVRTPLAPLLRVPNPRLAAVAMGDMTLMPNDLAAVGSNVTFTLTVTVPEGRTSDAVLEVAVLGAPVIAALRLESITASLALSASCNGTTTAWDALLAGATVLAGAQPRLQLPLCTLLNADSNNAVEETLTVVARASVLDVPEAVRGARVWANWTLATRAIPRNASLNASSNALTLVLPQLRTPVVSPVSSVHHVDAGDLITLETVLELDTSVGGDAVAYDLRLVDARLAQGVYALENVSLNGVE
jgi:hypothetical protein